MKLIHLLLIFGLLGPILFSDNAIGQDDFSELDALDDTEELGELENLTNEATAIDEDTDLEPEMDFDEELDDLKELEALKNEDTESIQENAQEVVQQNEPEVYETPEQTEPQTVEVDSEQSGDIWEQMGNLDELDRLDELNAVEGTVDYEQNKKEVNESSIAEESTEPAKVVNEDAFDGLKVDEQVDEDGRLDDIFDMKTIEEMDESKLVDQAVDEDEEGFKKQMDFLDGREEEEEESLAIKTDPKSDDVTNKDYEFPGSSKTDIIYRGASRSLIPWKYIDPVEWLNFTRWKNETDLKVGVPDWKTRLRQIRLREVVGRFVDCVGGCRVYRDEGFHLASYRSEIREGDEVATQKDSYGYLYLMDGTIVRLSPNTSVIFKEINFSNEKFLYNVRVNYGNLVWLGRSGETFTPTNERQTDVLFLPLAMTEANIVNTERTFDPDKLLDTLLAPLNVENHYKKLNEVISNNNKNIKPRKTFVHFVLPNGTLVAENPHFEVISLLGGKSFVKSRSFKGFNKESSFSTKMTVYFRGYENRESQEIEADKWYGIGARGRELNQLSKIPVEFEFNNLLTSRIPSVFLAREYFLRRYSSELLGLEHTDRTAAGLGYRLWNMDPDIDEIDMRLEFVKEYSRREETTGLLMAKKFRVKMDLKGEKLEGLEYNPTFYSKAMIAYSTRAAKDKIEKDRKFKLNSTKKRFWSYVKNRRLDK